MARDGAGAPGEGIRVLLADDARVGRMVGLKILAELGCEADAAANGVEVLAALQRKAYDLVLMDVQMPQVDGIQATRMIRSGAARVLDPLVVIVAMTGMESEGSEDSCRAAGMDDFLAKPVELAALAALLERWGHRLRKPGPRGSADA